MVKTGVLKFTDMEDVPEKFFLAHGSVPLYAGCAPRRPFHAGGFAVLFNADMRSILMVVLAPAAEAHQGQAEGGC